MFKLAQAPAFWAKVEAMYPTEDRGMQTISFDVRFRRLSTDELQALQERIREEQLDDRTVARELVVGWRGIEGLEGGEAPFTPEGYEKLLNLGLGSAICLTYFQFVPRARAKN